MFRKLLDEAQAGDNIGALLRGVQRADIERGQVLAKPESVHPHTNFVGQVYVLKERRRRKTYSILRWIQTTILFQNNRCNRINQITRWNGNGNARRSH